MKEDQKADAPFTRAQLEWLEAAFAKHREQLPQLLRELRLRTG